jgi:hypothetical protein
MADSGGGGCGCLFNLLDIGSAIDTVLACFDNWQATLAIILWLAGGVALVLVLAYYDVEALWYYVAVGGYIAGTVGLLWAYNAAELRRLR